MKRLIGVIFFLINLLLLLPINAGADQNIVTANFRYLAEQAVAVDSDIGFFVAELDPAVYATIDSSLRDLRIFSNGYELGYTLFQPKLNRDKMLAEEKLEVINQGPLQENIYSFVVVADKTVANQEVKVKLESVPYLVKGTLFGSNDNRSWQELKAVTMFGINGKYNEISLQGIDYDFLRIDFLQPPGEKMTVKEVNLVSAPVTETDLPSLNQKPISVSQNNVSQETLVLVDLQYNNRWSSEWQLNTTDKGFNRRVVVEGSNDREKWDSIGTTYIFRGVDPADETLSYSYGLSKYRYLRLRIHDQDNLPVEIQSVEVKVHPVKIISKVPPGFSEGELSFTAYWGDDTIGAPSYDVAKLVHSIEIDRYQVAILSSADMLENSDYNPVDPRPFSERYPFLLTAALIITVGIVGFILFNNVKRTV